MTYKSNKENYLNNFFCSDCDKLLYNGAYQVLLPLRNICEDCLSSFPSDQIYKNESIQEICECLKLIEETVRVTRTPQNQIFNGNDLECEVCEGIKKKAVLYCLNDEMAFCFECYENEHQSKPTKKHISKSIDEYFSKKIKSIESQFENSEYFCQNHNFVEPIFCLEDNIMFCPSCPTNVHHSHTTERIEEKAERIKKSINFGDKQSSFIDRIRVLNECVRSLKEFLKILEIQSEFIKKIIKEIQKKANELREVKEHWKQIENELDDKEWCKNEFVEKVKEQIVKVNEKWKNNEKNIIGKINISILEMNESISKIEGTILPKPKKHVNLLMVGLDSSGKSSILYKIKFGEISITLPTIGFNVEKIDFKNYEFTIWDVGGSPKIRSLWAHYYNDTQAVIYVIDSNDKERLEECKLELIKLLSSRKLESLPFLLLANKQDLSNSLSVCELYEELELSSIKDRKWHLQSTSAPTEEGIYEGLDWITKNLN